MKITGIVTDLIKHTDRCNVVTLFTRECGRMSFITHGGGGKRGASRMAMLMPLSAVSADIRHNPTRELQILTNAARATVWHDIYFNPAKQTVAIFLADFLNSYLRFSEADPALWDFTFDTIRHLDDTRRGYANIHLAFMIGMLSYAGISPDLSELDGIPPERQSRFWFDLREGVLTPARPLHDDIIPSSTTPLLPLLMRMTPANAPRFRFNAAQRRGLLDALLRYYAIHAPGMDSLKSPAVLRDLFS